MTDRSGGAGRRHLRVVDDSTVREHEALAVEAAREQALSLLTTKARSRSELAAALERKGVEPEVVVRVLERLEGVGLLDDRAVAEAYAEREAGRKGPRAIAEALQRKGIEPSLAREVSARSPDDVRAAASALARQKMPSWRGQARPVVERRLAGLLARRGYPAGIVYSVVREVLGEVEGGDPAELQTWAESDDR